MKRRPRAPMPLLALLVCSAVLLLPGCAGPGFVADFITGDENIEKRYQLPDERTAVVVDDPNRAMGAGVLVNVVANNVVYNLKNAKEPALLTAEIVPPAEVMALRTKLGEKEFNVTPIDRLGRMLGAEQVIYVQIESATLGEIGRTVYKPELVATVKVVDAVNSARLWPEGGTLIDSSAPPPGFNLIVKMDYEGTDHGGRGLEALLAQRLAERAGRDVARLFVDWKKPPPGSTIQ